METLRLQLKAYPTHSADYAGARWTPQPGMINEPTANGGYITRRSLFKVESQNIPYTGSGETVGQAAQALARKLEHSLANVHSMGRLQAYLDDHLLDVQVPQDAGLRIEVELDLQYGIRKPWLQLPAPAWNDGLPGPVHLFSRNTGEVDPGAVDAYEQAAQAAQSFVLNGPADPEAHTGRRVRLNQGWLYFTDIAEIGGQPTGSDGVFYVSDAEPQLARPGERRGHYRLHDKRRTGNEQPPEEGSLPQVVPHRNWQHPSLLAA